ncbi:hypothetical protein AL073_08120 [Loktanella sp. 1ANDIMAR09]|nr:hypothetical protein AL073_08120 [Loktanella sp. 1ANDIMAR09]
MIRVSFTKFLDFTAQNGVPKATTAISAWTQSNTPYDPATDYHRRIRQQLINYEKTSVRPDWEEFLAEQHPKKKSNFEDTINRYSNWRASFESIDWFDPPSSQWESSEFSVKVNPELGLILDGQKTAIKLFINRNKLSKLKAQIAGRMMHEALGEKVTNTRFAILDIKADKLHILSNENEKLGYLLIGEAAHLSAMIAAIRDGH